MHATIKTTLFLVNYRIAPRGAECPTIALNKGEAPLGQQIAVKVIKL